MTCALVTRKFLRELEELAHTSENAPEGLVPRAFDEYLRAHVEHAPTVGTLRVTDECYLDRDYDDFHRGVLVDVDANPLDVVSTCLWLLHLLENGEGSPSLRDIKVQDVRLLLSRTIMDNPVLMDARLLFDVRLDNASMNVVHYPLAHVLAYQSFGTLPSERQGFTQAQLLAFAKHPCVRRGLTRPPHDEAQLHAGVPDDTALETALLHFPETHGASRGMFVTSLIELSHLSLTHYGNALIEPEWHLEDEAKHVYQLGAEVFYDLAHGGGRSDVSRQEFLRAAALKAFERDGVALSLADPVEFGLREAIGKGAALGIFGITDNPFPGEPCYDPGTVSAAVVGAGRLLVDLGIASDAHEAAALLYEDALGNWRVDDDVAAAPHVPEPVALSFFDGILALDPSFDLATDCVLDRQDLEFASPHYYGWRAVRESVRARGAMSDVLSKVTLAPAAAARRNREV